MSGDLLALLGTLAMREVAFVVIGGMAGVLQGAPVVTADLDIVHQRTPENVAKLLATLQDLQAVFRDDPRRLVPTEAHLSGQGHLRLVTRLGPLDVLCEVHRQTYETLVAQSLPIALREGLSTRVVTLEKLIELKRLTARPKDLLALPVLQATLDEVRRRS